MRIVSGGAHGESARSLASGRDTIAQIVVDITTSHPNLENAAYLERHGSYLAECVQVPACLYDLWQRSHAFQD